MNNPKTDRELELIYDDIMEKLKELNNMEAVALLEAAKYDIVSNNLKHNPTGYRK